VVAGGGGGAGGGAAGVGGPAGAAGSAGDGTGSGGGGGAGTATAGGTKGAAGTNGTAGNAGSYELGGAGASANAFNNGSGGGGGGGGGGYYGGGGGGSSSGSGGGGGGGSSFVTPDATNVTGPTATGNAAEVTITYAAPTASPSTSSLSFGTVPEGVASAAQDVTITNNGSAPLDVSAVSVTGTNQGDYALNNGCQNPVAVSGSCQIGVRFAPQIVGASSATLNIETNASSSPATVSLSGTGAPDSSSTSLSLSKGTVTFGSEQLERFSVTVSPQITGVPTGMVAVRSGTVVLCTVTLSAGTGSCSPSAKALATGRHTITAHYAGDTNLNPSTSPSKLLTVKK
jgi:hypothetical protein